MNPPRHFALIPAAGIGARMGAEFPKQYMPLAGKPMLMHVLDTFAATAAIAHTFVVISADDSYIGELMTAAPQLQGRVTLLYCGGASRHESVLNGLHAMRDQVGDDDWVLVHDAARPGLTSGLIEHLIEALRDDAVGGLLALPVVDTLKRCDQNQRVAETVPRTALWAAQTPQMFRYGLLQTGLTRAESVTDEASAIEMLGLQPRLVEGSPRNFKVTLPHDVALAEIFLKDYS
ncbi:2-C-methyl-D-erythritol 4-phosphate cytidylyltransferase [Paraherbaspirillum soli]|uniref:2-C-methyl-D-erythritol 4-phosphate cytidylyltransferase n=1 Tax=Paraherbaspirillum soli TaxID=631222 RepID=A0ABW0MAX9_9BURK